MKWKKIPAHVLILEFGFISMRYCLDTVGEFLEQTFQSCLFDGSPEALLEGKYKHIKLGSILDYPKKELETSSYNFKTVLDYSLMSYVTHITVGAVNDKE